VRGAILRWILVFNDANLAHIGERGVMAADVADACFGRNGPARVRRYGRGLRERWVVVAPARGGDLLTCVLRAAALRDLDARGAFVLGPAGEPHDPGPLQDSMRLCVSARVSDDDERRSYRAWRRSKGGK
jgi:hypothetical protein